MIRLKHTVIISQGDTEVVSINGTDWLDSGELFTGTPMITESTGVLILANKAVSTAELTILSETVATGAAIQFTVADGVAGGEYDVVIACSTDATPARTVSRVLSVRCE